MTTNALTLRNDLTAAMRGHEADENKLAALLDNCLTRMSEGREVSFALRHAPEATAKIQPLVEMANLLQLRGRLIRHMAD